MVRMELNCCGAVSLPGLHMEEMYLADTLAWLGAKADFVQVGDYKGASEQMMRSAPSPQWDQNINALLDSMYANMRSPFITGRKFTEKKLDAAMEEVAFHKALAAVIELVTKANEYVQETEPWALAKDPAKQKNPDTLFFNRELEITGDTELGLIVKNMLDAVDWPRSRCAAAWTSASVRSRLMPRGRP